MICAADISAEVKRMLKAIGYNVRDGDIAAISVSAALIEREIQLFCHIPELPDALLECAAAMAAAEFLHTRKAAGLLDGFGSIDLTPVLKQLQEGDTNIAYDTGSTASPEQRMDGLIAALRSYRSQLLAFRRLAW